MVSVVRKERVLGPLLFILYTSEHFHIVSYANDTTVYTVICRPRDGIAESGFGSYHFLVFEVAYEAQP